jgi:hypothetical protein
MSAVQYVVLAVPHRKKRYHEKHTGCPFGSAKIRRFRQDRFLAAPPRPKSRNAIGFALAEKV